MSDSDRPTDPAPPSFTEEYGGDLPLAIIDRIAALSDAVCSPEGVVAMIRQEAREHQREASRNHESVVAILRSLQNVVLETLAKVNHLANEQEQHGARIKLVEHHHSNGNGASK